VQVQLLTPKRSYKEQHGLRIAARAANRSVLVAAAEAELVALSHSDEEEHAVSQEGRLRLGVLPRLRLGVNRNGSVCHTGAGICFHEMFVPAGMPQQHVQLRRRASQVEQT
jgi:hypothetical protein